MSTVLRVGFISGVRHAGDYLDVLNARADVRVVAVAEQSEVADWRASDSERVAHRAGVAFEPDLNAILDPARIDLAVICSEPTRHARLAIKALNAGINVLVDKPVGINAAEAAAVKGAAEKAGRIATVVNRTHCRSVQKIRHAIDAGMLGLPRHIDIEFLASGTHFATSVERPELVVDRSLSGGGELLNFLGYAVDYLHYLTGLAVVDVYGEAATLFGGVHEAAGVEDTGIVSLGLQHGVTATITVGRIPFAPGVGATSSSLRIIGSHGYAVADDDMPAIQHYGSESALSSLPLLNCGVQAGVEAFLGHVVCCLQQGKAPDYTIDHALATMQVIDAVYASVDKTARIHLDHIVRTASL